MNALYPLVLALGLLLGSCEFGSAPGADKLPPRIVYAQGVDTVGVPAVHDVLSTGGSIGLFRIEPAPPAGLAFDSLTGRVSGTPASAHAPRDYTVIATGPFGSDTAILRLWAVAPYDPGLAPSVVYETPAVDTVGKTASHLAFSLGGPVTSYAPLAPLPAGWTLNASTGAISGTPSAALAWTDFRVVATGPGGKDTATLRLAAVVRPAQQSPSQKPSIAYDSPAYDTLGVPARHPVVSLGGKVTSYALLAGNTLPTGLALDASTGLISGTPAYSAVWPLDKRSAFVAPKGALSVAPLPWLWTSRIVATGPGGKDTAEIEIEIQAQGAVASPEPGIALTVNLQASASKSSALTLKKMVITLTSNVATDAVVRDTVLAGTGGLTVSLSQTFSKHYAVKPLRHWTVAVKTLGARDSVLHLDSAMVNSLKVGEARTVNFNLARRYDTWNVKFNLPDSLGSGTASFKQKVNFRRLRVTLDGVTVRDTSLASYFVPAIPHTVEYDYVLSGTRAWKVEIFGDLPGWPSSLPLFAGTLTTGCVACASVASVSMAWTGPGSPSDPDYVPGSAGGSITPVPIVTISKVNYVIIGDDFGLGEPLPKR